MVVAAENKALALYLRSVLHGAPSVRKFWDDSRIKSIDIMTVSDCPVKGVSTYVTLGLSDTGTGFTSDESPLRVELLIALATNHNDAAHIIASCAFSAMNKETTLEPNIVIPRIIEIYASGAKLPHALLTTPFLWNLETQRFPSKTVAWLQVVPISNEERDYAETHGVDELETRFEERQIDVFNLVRDVVV